MISVRVLSISLTMTVFQLTDVNTHIEEERKVTREVREQLGLTDRRCNAMAGELEESKALLEAAIRYNY